jgi:predicted HD superfamily hydrolase involved in NAD metabolism
VAKPDWILKRGQLKSLLGGLSPERARHTLGVARTAEGIARALGQDADKAYVTGLLHDCAKGLAPEKLRSLLPRSGADRLEKSLPPLWHAPVGALLCKTRYGIDDPEVLEAVRLHSTGAAGMGPLAQVLFVADFAEPTRKYPEGAALRKLAKKDLAAALRRVVALKVAWVLRKGQVLHPKSIELWNSLC